MNNQDQIIQKQNDEEMLKCQYAARVCFNHAELLSELTWIFSIMAAFSIFIPNSNNLFFLFIPATIDLCVFIFNKLASRAVLTAASLRNYFDYIVLNVIPDQYTKETKQEIRQKALEISARHKRECAEQITHTSRDNPPGVRNWYEFHSNSTVENATYECQKQNCWWNKQLSKVRNIIGIALIIIMFAIFFILVVFMNLSIPKVIICFISLFINLFDLVKENYYYFKVSSDMQAVMAIPGVTNSEDYLQHLQELICKRREIPVLEFNILYKRRSRYLSELYEKSQIDK